MLSLAQVRVRLGARRGFICRMRFGHNLSSSGQPPRTSICNPTSYLLQQSHYNHTRHQQRYVSSTSTAVSTPLPAVDFTNDAPGDNINNLDTITSSGGSIEAMAPPAFALVHVTGFVKSWPVNNSSSAHQTNQFHSLTNGNALAAPNQGARSSYSANQGVLSLLGEDISNYLY
ncbi:unnamed protein product [Protopolystoma xenopodis]|uniref:Uncharacterized protein n=1 Tax=Protopolystoma xenopodis TaxID=117903 RepID=A0A3S5BX68_9PLAT|nr:unnamed protein product [Protopolystoma xenopodis]VEL44324.1 unnamed protein product [Protopolystoma xenopodis]